MSTAPPPPTPDRTSHPFHMYEMIYDIPKAIEATLRNNADDFGHLGARLKDRKRSYFTGCGTAYYSAALAQRVSATLAEQSIAVQALELPNFQGGIGIDPDSLVIGVSHSGITKTTVDALAYAKAIGAYTLGVTHFRDTPLFQVSDHTVVAGDSPDASRCHTKCYITSAVAAISVSLERSAAAARLPQRRAELEDGIRSLPSLIAKLTPSVDKNCEQIAAKCLHKQDYYIVGVGPNFVTAQEAALKFKETSYIPAEGAQTEQLAHGGWQPLDSDSVLFVISTEERSHARSLDLVRAAREVGTSTVAIVNDDEREISNVSDHVIRVPRLEEYLSPFVAIVPMYLIAYYSSVKRGFNPDLLRYIEPDYWRGRQFIFPPGTH